MSRDARAHAWIRADTDGRILDAGGALADFGIAAPPAPGTSLARVADFLHGLADPGWEVADLPRVQVGERFADVHAVRDELGTLVLLVDVTDDAQRWHRVQQRYNAAQLATERGVGPDLKVGVLAELLAAMGAAVFEAVEGARLRLLAGSPDWLTALFGAEAARGVAFDPGEPVPFLETFLAGARKLWASGEPRSEASGVWTETCGAEELPFEATAVLLPGGARLLVIRSQRDAVRETRRMLQTAREAALDHRRLQREIEKKDLLLGCIVHDLKGPLSGMTGALSMLARGVSPERTRQMIDMGLRQARMQREMIQDVLHVFSSDLRDADPTGRAVGAADVVACAREALEALSGALEERRLTAVLDPGAAEAQLLVVGAADRLRRVFTNLLENAVRFAPPGSKIEVSVAARTESVRIEVRDRGPGIDPAVADTLFQPRTSGGAGAGSAGLGLYYCASTVQRWGGSIGYEARPEAGALFWFELPRA